ncbi:MAG: site-2 protease family protein [Alphaproteobacteria bacterium]|nr:site-2 protease family protein [Alphaproteobacteria bacterium]
MNEFLADPTAFFYELSVIAIPVIIAITFHEAAHGWVAHRLGDDTAYRLGRVSFNPFRHVDPFGTVILPLLLKFAGGPLFGYAKPVPVHFGRLRQPRRDMVLVALAGPGVNVLLALIAGYLHHVAVLAPEGAQAWFATNLEYAVVVNLLLAVFNMIPLPPLDGGRVAVGILPDALALPLARLERIGIPLLIAVLFLAPWLGDVIGVLIDPMGWAIWPAVEALMTVVGALTFNDWVPAP